MSISEAAYLSMLARSGRTEREWAESLRPDGDPAGLREAGFSYGLDRFLDGLAARLAAH
ncbi:hypothetical protein [Spirillospora sp. NPDC029432]|uniref:hypothetical protein n=1 Tax=Spirillospora sp. NPDC029432 TaxID=3154599 RepID=UPI003454452F